ncbi:MAG: hypothetical protein ACT4P4_10145 [Betaproteobacteria bacterium]
MAVFVVAHGAWSAELVAPTYAGIGERAHLGSPHIDLEAHIADLLAVLHYEDLRDIVRREAGWKCHEIDASRSPQITAPDLVAGLLDTIACLPS